MRDRGTLIAGAGIGLAFLIAGVAYLFILGQQASDRAQEDHARAVEEQHHVQEMQRLAQVRDQGMKHAAARSPDEAIAAGADWLVQQQSPDGSWRSETYATFKSGTALTPQVVVALQAVNKPGLLPLLGRDPIQTGCEWLVKGGTDLDYPVYTAALAVIALSHPDQKPLMGARDAWLGFLLSHQLTEQNGWKPDDKPYGGWGYCRYVPKKPEPGGFSLPLVESNLSATVFALEALKAAGVKDKVVYAKALAFVRRCQNLQPPDAPMMPPEYGDGGFHFIYDDPVRNKAGSILPRAASRDAFNSYGSATADGLRALRLAGETETLRLEAAERWLKTHFRADLHPGKYIPAHEMNRDAVYFYYAASVSKAWSDRASEWGPKLAAELMKRQNPDGSWNNPRNLVREDEPLVATAAALIALANCTRK